MLHFLRTYGSWQSALIHLGLLFVIGLLFAVCHECFKDRRNDPPWFWYALVLLLLAVLLSACLAGICREIAFELLV